MIWRIRWLLISVQAGGCGLQIGILRYFQCTKSFAGMLCSNTNDFKLFNLLPPIFPLSRHGISYNGQQHWGCSFGGGAPFCENLIMQLSKVRTENMLILWWLVVCVTDVLVFVYFFWFCVFLCLCLYFWPVGCVSWHVNCTEVCLTQPASSKMPIRARKHYGQRRCRAFILPKNAWKVNTKALNGT